MGSNHYNRLDRERALDNYKGAAAMSLVHVLTASSPNTTRAVLIKGRVVK